MELKFCIALFSMLVFSNCVGQTGNDELIISKFNSIDESPTVISFSNTKKVNNHGGHLQGIQLIPRDTFNYAVLSGSSNSYAYYAVVKLGDTNEVISVNRLMDTPFKHAGGFQIFENYLAVGIEDNSKKDRSKVSIYDISEPENPVLKPIAVIEREGKPKRSTAGCVGITNHRNKALVVVGDWNTKNIDFYSCSFKEIDKNNFELVYSIDTEKISKVGWIDNNWHAYQNINLISFENSLYLLGLGQNSDKEDMADLFSLKEVKTNHFNLRKLASKTFKCNHNASFQAGAGIYLNDDVEMSIISCSFHIGNTTYINYFESHQIGSNVLEAEIQIIPAHAHNDYEHSQPLLDALGCYFKSIEADVYSVGDSLFVAHDFIKIKPGRTLRQLYLEPLKNQISKNKGSVYGNGKEVILFIDIKDNGLKTYQLLHRILQGYQNEVSVFENGVKKERGILVVISGNRPFEYMQSQKIRYAGFDGRLEDVDSDILPTLMPVVSDNWTKYFKWNGIGEMPMDERQRLQELAAKAKNKGYVLRFWSTPNRTSEQRNAVWTELQDAGVGLIGADHIKELQQFLQLQ